MNKLELHCHSGEVSVCASCSAEQLIRHYREAGYSGVVSTNHINRGTYEKMEDWPWKKKAEHFIAGFHVLQDAAGDDFDVLLGCEINLSPILPLPSAQLDLGWPKYIPNDYLVYGVTEDWLLHIGDVRTMPLGELSNAVRREGFLFVHAHPFRSGTVMQDPDLFDGYEVYNGNPRHRSNNDLAEALSDLRNKIKTGGSDYHRPDDPACGGIATVERIRDNAALLDTLRGGRYTLLRAEP